METAPVAEAMSLQARVRRNPRPATAIEESPIRCILSKTATELELDWTATTSEMRSLTVSSCIACGTLLL
jgi:hypothetical protein